MWEQWTRPWLISLLIRKHCEEWLMIFVLSTSLCTFMTFFMTSSTNTSSERHMMLVYTGALLYWLHTLQRSLTIWTLYMQNSNRPASSCRPGEQRYSSVETCVGDRVSFVIPQTHPHPLSPILSHPLITHTRALKQQEGKMLRMQNRRAACTRVRVSWKKERDRGGREERVCLCVCDASTFCSLWIFTKAL